MNNRKPGFLIALFVSALIAISFSSDNFAGTGDTGVSPVPLPTPGIPPYSAYRGVSIGTLAAEARTKLGKPKETADDQDFYIFSDSESAQIYYDAAKKVTAISVTYTGKLDKVPDPASVFGEAVEAKADGSISKLVRYPKAGFWISYNKTAGDDPLVMIAMQKF